MSAIMRRWGGAAATLSVVEGVRRQTDAPTRGLALPGRGGAFVEDAGFTENRNGRAELSRRYLGAVGDLRAQRAPERLDRKLPSSAASGTYRVGG